jgi:hypothetical protein
VCYKIDIFILRFCCSQCKIAKNIRFYLEIFQKIVIFDKFTTKRLQIDWCNILLIGRTIFDVKQTCDPEIQWWNFLSGVSSDAIDHSTVEKLCMTLNELHRSELEIGLVLGGGSIFRGLPASIASKCDRPRGDYMGMLTTVIKCLAVQDPLERSNGPTCVSSSFPMPNVCDTFLSGMHYRI